MIYRNNNHWFWYQSSLALIVMLLFIIPAQTLAATTSSFDDDEGCLMCHKYPSLTRITDEGVKRSYYVMPEVYANTVHRNVPCRDCHTSIKQLPHREVKEGVVCSTQCHSVKNPATGKPFSHKAIYNIYKESVHGREKMVEGINSDKPYCITCHNNPLYDPGEVAPPKKIIDRCVLCHEDEVFVKQWYKHTSRRIRDVKRTSKEIVQLCSSCHGDEKLIERHLNYAVQNGNEIGRKFAVAVESYSESFHGKLTSFGVKKVANCLDCHADRDNYYKSVHEILPSRNPQSPVHVDNRVETCQQCHELADDNYVRLDVHPTSKGDDGSFRLQATQAYDILSLVAIIGLVSLSLFETWGRWRDGVSFQLKKGTSWRRRSKRGRDRVQGSKNDRYKL